MDPGAMAAGTFTFSDTCSVTSALGAHIFVALPQVWVRWAPAQAAQASSKRLALALWRSILDGLIAPRFLPQPPHHRFL
jgi:hypothetical protein